MTYLAALLFWIIFSALDVLLAADGKRIIYSATGPDGRYCLFSMMADGTEKRQLTQPPAPYIDARASVGPDSFSIVFNCQKGDGTISIHTVKAAN